MNFSPLRITPQEEAVERANAKIYKGMTEKYPGLITRWKKVNRAVGGTFRFGEITTIAGPSGSGKSFFLNMIRDDFASELNADYPEPFKILSFSFEMGAADEVIRTYSTRLGISYRDLMSSDQKLTKEYYRKIRNEVAKTVQNDIIYYVESTGNRERMKATVNKSAA
jgi:replicative DNA helicase